LSFVSGEQDAADGLKGPMELSQHGAKRRASNVDQRVERDQPAESLGRALSDEDAAGRARIRLPGLDR
jgi:hypothetical protein